MDDDVALVVVVNHIAIVAVHKVPHTFPVDEGFFELQHRTDDEMIGGGRGGEGEEANLTCGRRQARRSGLGCARHGKHSVNRIAAFFAICYLHSSTRLAMGGSQTGGGGACNGPSVLVYFFFVCAPVYKWTMLCEQRRVPWFSVAAARVHEPSPSLLVAFCGSRIHVC